MATIDQVKARRGIIGVMLAAAALAGCGQSLSSISSNTASITPPQATAQPEAVKAGERKVSAVKIALLLPTGGFGEPAQIARGKGITGFEAEVLPVNAAMLGVFRHSGLPLTEQLQDDVVHVEMDLAAPAPA